MSLKKCSVALIVTQLKHLCDIQENGISSFSIINFCNICNHIYLLIIGTTNGLTKQIQLELMKYWLECMGIIRAIAEAHNINFVKYMNRCSSNQM
jgi:penicillin-binding protein-related factor A (putative recombinase)